MTERRGAGAAWTAGAALAVVSAAALAVLRPGGTLHGVSDESLLVPLARAAWDPSLYPGDAWLALAAQVFGRAYSFLLGAALRVADDPVAAGRLLALPFHAAFLAGCFRIADRAGGRGAAWTCAALLVALPPVFAVATSGDLAWPLGPGASLPRDLVLAILPWTWLARDAALAAGRLGPRLAAGFATGVLANLHPLTAIHAVALVGVLDLLRRPFRTAVRDAFAVGAVSLAGALPYVLQWRGFPRTPGEAPRDVLLWRIEGIGAWTPSVWASVAETALWFALGAVAAGWGRPDPARRALRVAAVVAAAGCALAPAINPVVTGVQFDRLSRFAVWFAVLAIAAEIPAAVRARDVRSLGLAAAFVALGVGGRPAVRLATGADRGPVEWLARRAEVRLGVVDARRPAVVPDRPRPGEPSADPARAAAFRDVCAWIRTGTPVAATVLVPPEDFGAFRAYAARGVTVTRKEGGFALTFLGGRGIDWFAEYVRTVEAYAGAPEGLAAEAGRRGAAFAVADVPEAPVPRDWTEVHAAGPYRVFRTGGE